MKQVKPNGKVVCPKCFRALDVVVITTFNPKTSRLVKRCKICKTEEEIERLTK